MSAKSKLDAIFKANPPKLRESKITLEQQWKEFLSKAISKGYSSDQALVIAEKFAVAEKIKMPTKSTFQKYWTNANAAAKAKKTPSSSDADSVSDKQTTPMDGTALFQKLVGYEEQLDEMLLEEISPTDALSKIAGLLRVPANLQDFLKLTLARADTQSQLEKLRGSPTGNPTDPA